MNLYITADDIGSPSGGGQVTLNEFNALQSLGPTHPIDGLRIPYKNDPFALDRSYHDFLKGASAAEPPETYRGGRAHLYAGCFSNTVEHLKKHMGMAVSYTCAAHDIKLSKEEHEGFGIGFPYPHLVDPGLFAEYIRGYKDADLVICPSRLSAKIVQGYGCKTIGVVPHGIVLPDLPEPPPGPKEFTVGYFGAPGPDKGLRYLLEAWKKLNYKDAVLLFGGRGSLKVPDLVRIFGGGNVEILGPVDDIGDFYRRISVYCQPSVTEGFGIEVLEAMAYWRPVIVSEGAGAVDVIENGLNGAVVPIRNADAIADRIEAYRVKLETKKGQDRYHHQQVVARKTSEKYSWAKVQDLYRLMWGAVVAAPPETAKVG